MTSGKLWSWTVLSSAPKLTQTLPPWRCITVAMHCSWPAIVVIAFAFVYLTKSIAAVNPDGEALLAFKAVLQDPTGILKSWKASDPDPCLWDGVTCNTMRQVQRLVLQDTQLSGPISGPALRSLSELRTLVLSRNNFSGAFPSELSQIVTLWKLNVSENGLSGLLPASLGNLSRLRMLDLSRNGFTGQIPPDLFKACLTLRFVSLADNRFSGAIPSTLWQCSTLVGLNIAFNSLQGILPSALAHLTLLEFMDLHRNELSGTIPVQLSRLTNIIFLDLGCNLMRGTIPSDLGALVRLQSLNLARMGLQGAIPASFANLSSLQQLDLSANNLTGDIIPELGLVSGLQGLFLQHNHLNGIIPASLGNLVNLTRLDVSYNKLSGRIPSTNGFVRFDNASYLGNRDLCGPPLSIPCPAVPAPVPTFLLYTRRRLLSVSALIAIAAAGAIALGVILITLLSIWALWSQTEGPKTDVLVFESTPPSPDEDVGTPIIGKLVLFNKMPSIRFEDWETGTKALLNDECLLGRGSLGTVHRATFDNGLSIVIKKLVTLRSINNASEFESEMDYLGVLRHLNLVTFQGYYWSSSMQLMMWDWIAKGTLASHLHGSGSRESTTALVWSQRFRIAIGMARGLAFLHHDLRSPVLHLNFSSANVLLDECFEPKISDFGMTKLLALLGAQTAKRTGVYAAPELAGASPCVTSKCDVYSYGMVLLELMTGRHPELSNPVDGADGVTSLSEFVIRMLESDNGPDCFDPKLNLFPASEVMQVIKLALVCTAKVASNRPTMGEAVQILESVKPSESWTSRSPSP